MSRASSSFSRRTFLGGMAALAVAGPAVVKAAPFSFFSKWREYRTEFDPADLVGNPLLVDFIPVQVTDDAFALHGIFAGAAECYVAYTGRDGAQQRTAIITTPEAVNAVTVPLTGLEPGETYFWQVFYRSTARKRWSSTPVRTTRLPMARQRSSRIIFASDTHANIEGIEETATTDGFIYAHREGYFGDFFPLVRGEYPDAVFFGGDEVGTFSNYIWRIKNQVGLQALFKKSYMEMAFLQWRLWRQRVAHELPGLPVYQALGNHEGVEGFSSGKHQWSIVARKFTWPHPRPEETPLGGENAHPPGSNQQARRRGYHSPLENYYGVRIGGVDVAVLDVMSYTNVALAIKPTQAREWSYGEDQIEWLRSFLEQENRLKIVLTHHLSGGAEGGSRGESEYAYGRGGAHYAFQHEQNRISKLLLKYRRHFQGIIHLSGHDHNWWHALVTRGRQVDHRGPHAAYADSSGVLYAGMGSPSHLAGWGNTPFFETMYRGQDLFAKGYIRLSARRNKPARLEYIKCGQPDLWFDGQPQAELRAPDTPVGKPLDSIEYGD